jgi:hypothetical protein
MLGAVQGQVNESRGVGGIVDGIDGAKSPFIDRVLRVAGGHPVMNSGQREIARRPQFPLLLSPLTVSDTPNTF